MNKKILFLTFLLNSKGLLGADKRPPSPTAYSLSYESALKKQKENPTVVVTLVSESNLNREDTDSLCYRFDQMTSFTTNKVIVDSSFYPRDCLESDETFEKVGECYLIINKATGKVLSTEKSGDLIHLGLDNKGKQDNKLWEISSVGNDYYKIVNKSNKKVLEAIGLDNYEWKENRVVYQGEPVRLAEYKGLGGQKWRFIDPLPVYTYQDVKK